MHYVAFQQHRAIKRKSRVQTQVYDQLRILITEAQESEPTKYYNAESLIQDKQKLQKFRKALRNSITMTEITSFISRYVFAVGVDDEQDDSLQPLDEVDEDGQYAWEKYVDFRTMKLSTNG